MSPKIAILCVMVADVRAEFNERVARSLAEAPPVTTMNWFRTDLGGNAFSGLIASQKALLLFLVGLFAGSAVWGQPFPTNNNPANQIRFTTPAEAEARRSTLVNYIWEGGLPTTTPAVAVNVAFPNLAVGIDPANVARVDRLNSNVSGWGYNANAYLMHPTNTANANRLVIVHQGHAHDLFGGVGATANHLLQQGFTVLAMKMPLTGLAAWSNDNTAFIAGYQGFRSYASHDDMIYNTGPSGGGQGFRFFLEPVVQGINHAVANMEGLTDISMIGLSGGGWTTSLMAAIDPRISLSVPVAGSAPLYRRNADPGAVGDAEQFYTPLYNENIQPNGTGGGVATWLEIYALGGFGEGRRQIQVTNQFDNCCFAGTFPNDFKDIVSSRVESLGSGQWEHVIDSTHHVHQISSHVLKSVIDPLLGITGPTPNSLPLLDHFDDQSSGVPRGWSIDPSSSAGTTAVESGGKVTIAGTGLDSIVYNAPFNSQLNHPITITLGIESMSSDNFMGVFLTDNIGSRGFHLGPLINASSRQVLLNADNGAGFNPSQDRITLGTVPGYSGGEAVLTFTFDSAGFAVTFDADAAGSFSSGFRPWSQIPGGFDPTKLGEQTQLFIQSFDVNGGSPASLVVDFASVTTNFLPGDFNSDGLVDALDFTVWRNALGSNVTPWRGADGNGDGTVDAADYLIWKANFGHDPATTAASPGVPIPEPAGWALLLALATFGGWKKSRYSSPSVFATQ
jgi:hypothetical protein